MSEPTVTVVIPVYDDVARLRTCLAALEAQTYPAGRTEILVVDNGSPDDVTAAVGRHPRVRVLYESTPGSYTARNHGLRHVSGEFIAFTDSDCIPAPGWLEHAVRCLREDRRVGLVAGRIEVFFDDPDRPSSVELFEALHAFPQRRYAEESHFGATANVVTRKSVIDAVGPFDHTLTSGGDKEWGRRVHAAGFEVRYCDEAVVRHPARRTWQQLYGKHARTVAGYTRMRRSSGYSLPQFLKDLSRAARPPIGTVLRSWSDPRLPRLRWKLGYAWSMFRVRYADVWLRLRFWLGAAPPRT